ncbi:MAG: response regulator [Desulfuromonadaceae bacterium]|nr:response regulator [Desulfuromonadaceae bacterium]MDD2849773.1 response regulator [Desulfuromonadaceae bacterium]MDD4130727.1 response regulator [Desulfuromonadaceae bacterium]
MLAHKPDKILIVDDEEEIGQSLKMYLASEGYAATLATNGSVALDMLLTEKDHTVVLLDINMPGLNGVTVLKRLHEAGSDAAVIMMSGHGSEELAVECMKNGAEDYLSKPFALADMLQRIERARTHRRERAEKKQLQQEKEDFILMLSHDMKNPLTAVIGSIDIIREGCLGVINEEQTEYLQSAIDSCNEVVTMIDNLLDIRKFEAGKIQMAVHPYNAHELISRITNQFTRPAIHDGIELSVDLEAATSTIDVDKNSFTRVLGNLLGNALKFTPEGGKISVSCRCISDMEAPTLRIPEYAAIPPDFLKNSCFVRLAVSDTGNGIPQDELDRIFDRYTQLTQRTERERGGAGLGLAYCKLAVESFHGMIWAECEAGQGSKFVILLPCRPDNGNCRS